jgi:hypothetical protein
MLCIFLVPEQDYTFRLLVCVRSYVRLYAPRICLFVCCCCFNEFEVNADNEMFL